MLDLTCASKFHKGALGSAFVFGWVLTLLWLPSLGDKYGRKTMFRITVFTDLLLLSALLFIKAWVPMVIVITLLGCLNSTRWNIGFLYCLEFFTKEKSPIVGLLCGVSYGLVFLIIAVYFWHISKNWIYLMIGVTVLQLCAAISALFIPESPRWLMAMGKKKELFEVVTRIAKSNGKTITEEEFSQELFDSELTEKDLKEDSKSFVFYIR